MNCVSFLFFFAFSFTFPRFVLFSSTRRQSGDGRWSEGIKSKPRKREDRRKKRIKYDCSLLLNCRWNCCFYATVGRHHRRHWWHKTSSLFFLFKWKLPIELFHQVQLQCIELHRIDFKRKRTKNIQNQNLPTEKTNLLKFRFSGFSAHTQTQSKLKSKCKKWIRLAANT